MSSSRTMVVFGFMIDFGSNRSGASHFAGIFRQQEWALLNGVVLEFADCVEIGTHSANDSSCCYVRPPGMSLPCANWRLERMECRVEVLRRFYDFLTGCQGFRFAQAGWEVFDELSVPEILSGEFLHDKPPPGLVISRELWIQARKPKTFLSFSEYAMWCPLVADKDYLEIARAFPGEG